MSSPSIKRFLIKTSSNLNSLSSSDVILNSIEAFSPNCRTDQMYHSIVSFVAQRGPGPSFFVHDSLELLLGDIGLRVSCSAVTQDDAGRFAHLCQTCKVVFCVHLEANEQTLEFYALLDVELGHENHASSMHY